MAGFSSFDTSVISVVTFQLQLFPISVQSVNENVAIN